MTQYKNPFEDPEEKLWDKKVKDYKIPERKETLEEKAGDADLKGYIYVPSIDLYVAKEKSLHGLNWEDTHKELHKQDLQMLTIRQVIDFMLYLKQNPSPDAKKILDDVLTVRKPDRLEWLDAMFSNEGGLIRPASSGVIMINTFIKEADADYQGWVARGGFGPGPTGGWPGAKSNKKAGLYIHYNHRIENGKLVAKNVEPLEECLMEQYDIDLKSCNKQGLPTKKGGDIGYYYPIESRVGGLNVSSVYGTSWAGLDCHLNPEYFSPDVGVRAARKVK